MNWEQLKMWRLGFAAAMTLFAIWRDNGQWCGSNNYPLEETLVDLHSGKFDEHAEPADA